MGESSKSHSRAPQPAPAPFPRPLTAAGPPQPRVRAQRVRAVPRRLQLGGIDDVPEVGRDGHHEEDEAGNSHQRQQEGQEAQARPHLAAAPPGPARGRRREAPAHRSPARSAPPGCPRSALLDSTGSFGTPRWSHLRAQASPLQTPL